MIEKVILGFGSNAGNRLNNITSAVKKISYNKDFDLIALSSVYETEPWGYSKQKSFLNCFGVFLCRIDAPELLKFLRKTEISLGRIRREKWHAREIDIDILFYGKSIINKKGLEVPHPMISARNFVLLPLVELVPGLIHPKSGRSIENILAASKDKCKVRLHKKRN
jgi:2-amino-4-hydroxy-6-hydroxymethyldihydropteridine diphosphokinase